MGMREHYFERIRYHLWALAPVVVAVVVGQVATLTQPTLVSFGNDSPTYVLVAQKLITSPLHGVDALRTPGYPLLLTIVFLLSGGVNFSAALGCYGDTTSVCAQIFTPVVIAQVVVTIATVFECYLLAYRLSSRRWIAATLASLIAVNLFALSWERMVLTETLSVWSLVTLFLCFERFMRRPTLGRATLLALLCVFAVLVRPFAIYIPPLLLAGILARSIWTKGFSTYWRQFTLVSVLVCSALVAYMAWNGADNGDFGLSWVTDVNLFGKVLEYRMQDLTQDNQYAQLRTEADAYVSQGRWDPYTFAQEYGINYYQDHATLVGGYARSIITHNIGTYAMRSVPDLITLVRLHPGYLFYPTYGVDATTAQQLPQQGALTSGVTAYPTRYGLVSDHFEPWWINVLLIITTGEQMTYLVFPLALLLAVGYLLRRPRSIAGFTMLLIGLAVVGSLVLIASVQYVEFERIRFPMDWGMFLVTGVMTLRAVEVVVKRVTAAWTAGIGNGNSAAHVGLLAEAPGAVASRPAQTGDLARIGHGGHPAAVRTREVAVIIPVYNELKSLEEVVSRVLRQPHVSEVIIVDDCSTDGTRELLQGTPWPSQVRVLYHEQNMGKGAGIRTGVQAARKDIVIIQDADLEYDPDDFGVVLEPIFSGAADVVYGSRFLGQHDGFIWHHLLGNKMLTLFTNVLYHNGVTDMETCYKAFRASIIKNVSIRSNRFDFEPEITAKVSKMGYRIVEVPISYHGRGFAGGKKITWRDGVHAVWALLRFRFTD